MLCTQSHRPLHHQRRRAFVHDSVVQVACLVAKVCSTSNPMIQGWKMRFVINQQKQAPRCNFVFTHIWLVIIFKSEFC